MRTQQQIPSLRKYRALAANLPSMQKAFILLLTSCLTLIVNAQVDIKSYVEENCTQVRTIEPDSTDYSDLESVGDAIGNSRIVMLGEQDHGDAPTFLAKTRLIRYLHEKKGFNVIAFESDFFALNNGWDNLNKSEDDIYNFLRKNVTGVWSYCDGCQFLLKKLIPQSFLSKNPITITGVDNQMALTYSNKNLTHQLDSVLRSLNLLVTKDNSYTTIVLPIIDSLTKFLFRPKNIGFYDNAVAQLILIKSQMNTNSGNNSFWHLVIENLIHLALEFKYLPSDIDKGRNERDIQMANNLKWLCSVKYPNEKIIVWAQNFHVSKYSGHYSKKVFNDLISMGTVFTQDTAYTNKTYIIGFTSFTGETGIIGTKPYAVETPSKNSFENWIKESYSYAFTDFKKFNLLNSFRETEFKMNGSVVDVLHKKYTAEWTRIFDGVFYIKNMYPCKVAK